MVDRIFFGSLDNRDPSRKFEHNFRVSGIALKGSVNKLFLSMLHKRSNFELSSTVTSQTYRNRLKITTNLATSKSDVSILINIIDYMYIVFHENRHNWPLWEPHILKQRIQEFKTSWFHVKLKAGTNILKCWFVSGNAYHMKVLKCPANTSGLLKQAP